LVGAFLHPQFKKSADFVNRMLTVVGWTWRGRVFSTYPIRLLNARISSPFYRITNRKNIVL
jgi:hypothetical protein